MHKWKLMISTLPVPLAAVVLRFLLEYGFQLGGSSFPGIMDFSALSPVLTGGVFLIGLMLSGTLQDYKESEKIPAELACCLETMDETVSWVAGNRPAVNERTMRETLLYVTDELYAWLLKQRTQEQCYAAIERLDGLVRDFDKLNAGLPTARLMAEIHSLRKTVTRIGVISRTGFLASGYALLDTLVGSVLVLLLIASYKAEFGTVGKYIIIGFVALIYSYLWRLVKDVDDPFEYSPTGERSGAAEVELFPLTEYQQRARAHLRSMGSTASGDLLPAVSASSEGEKAEPPSLSLQRKLVIAVVALLLLLGGGGLLWRFGGKLRPSPRLVRWSLSTAPAGAEVVAEDGTSLGRTPLLIDKAEQPGAQLLHLRLAGYQETRLVCHRNADCVVDAVLIAPPPPPVVPAVAAPAIAPAKSTDEPSSDEPAGTKKKGHHRRHRQDDSEASSPPAAQP